MQLVIAQRPYHRANTYAGGLLQWLNNANNHSLRGDGLMSSLFNSVKKTAAASLKKGGAALKRKITAKGKQMLKQNLEAKKKQLLTKGKQLAVKAINQKKKEINKILQTKTKDLKRKASLLLPPPKASKKAFTTDQIKKITSPKTLEKEVKIIPPKTISHIQDKIGKKKIKVRALSTAAKNPPMKSIYSKVKKAKKLLKSKKISSSLRRKFNRTLRRYKHIYNSAYDYLM